MIVENAVCDDGTLLDVRQNGAKFVWHVFDKKTKTTQDGVCETLEQAKAAAENVAACKPKEWTRQNR
jgi:phage-related protein